MTLMSVVVCICMTTLTACEGDIEEIIDDYPGAMAAIQLRNDEALQKIKNAGFISEKEYKTLSNSLQGQLNQYLKLNSDADNTSTNVTQELLDVLKDAIRHNFAGNCGEAHCKGSGSQWTNLANASSEIVCHPGAYGSGGCDRDPLSVFNTSDIDEITKRMNYKICVLKPTDDTYNQVNMGVLATTLKDLEKNEGNFDKLNQSEKSLLETIYSETPYRLLDEKKIPVIKATEANYCHKSNMLGKDYVLTSGGGDGIAISLFEINPEFLEAIGANGAANKVAQKYVVDNTNNKLYLIQYPVYIMDSLERIKSGKTWKWHCTFNTKCDTMEVNLKDGSVVNKDGEKVDSSLYHVADGNNNSSFVFAKPTDGNTNSTTGSDKAAYKITTITKENGSLTEKKYTIDDCLKICLVDYLEMTYLPTVVDGEDYIALGRKVRLTKFTGKDKTPIAKFIDKKGNTIDASIKIYATDLMDVRSGYNVTYSPPSNGGSSGDTSYKKGKKWKKVKCKLAVGKQKPGTVKISTASSNGTVTDDASIIPFTKIKYFGSNKAAKKTDYYSQCIFVTRTFGYTNIKFDYFGKKGFETAYILGGKNLFGAIDADKFYTKVEANTGVDNAFMFGINIDMDLFKSELYSGWIDVEDGGTKGSLDWWNEWLKKAGLNYQIDKNRLMDVLGMNYSISMSDDDSSVIVDLETISKIQDEYDRKRVEDRAKNIRTMFICLGFFCIAYAIMIIAAWVIDTSLVGGPKLLGMLTFHKCVAVQSNLGIPDSGNERYMTFGKALSFALVVMSIGIVIVLVDSVTLLSWVKNTFGTVVDIIRNIMLND